MSEHVPNDALRLDAVPVDDAPWREISGFAFTFHAYDHWPGPPPLATLANGASRTFRERGTVPDTLTALRACLFFEHRRKVHTGEDPNMPYVHAIVRAIRDKVSRGELA